MSGCVVRMEMPKEGCHTCDARCVSALYGYICGIERKNVIPFLGKKNRPDWCPIVCPLPEGHGRLGDLDELERKVNGARIRAMQDGRDTNPYWECGDIVASEKTIVPAERSET